MKLHLTDQSLAANQAPLAAYAAHLASIGEQNTVAVAEAAINVPTQETIISEVRELVKQKVSSQLKSVFVIGIGGSNLGTKAIYDALYAPSDIGTFNHPRLHFIDTNNAAQLQVYLDEVIPAFMTKEEFLVVSISKSGGTTETIANTEIILGGISTAFADWQERMVVITGEDSVYWNAAKEQSIATLAIPAQVGGRYSVLTAVGLFPLAAIGVDIEALLKGAQDIQPYCVTDALEDNIAAQSASMLFSSNQAGKTINDNFVFNSELESLGRWYRQLMGESVGKKENVHGEVVHAGLTPTVSVGSTDLHSVGQLYLGGPKDKVTTFIYSESDALLVPVARRFPGVVEMISGKSTEDIMVAIREGVKIAYQKADLPYMEVELEGITPYELGAFMQFKMLEMMYLGALMEVNPFNQPNVESYKVETKNLLEAA